MAPTDAVSSQSGHYVQANGLDIYYEEYGSGRPLILIHGGTTTSQSWQAHLASFTSHYRVITPDSRAHGKTHNPTGKLSYRVMADDVAALIQALNLNKPDVFGYSDGGQIALELGMRYPNLTNALVIFAAAHTFSDAYFHAITAMGFEGPGVVYYQQMSNMFPGVIEYLQSEHHRTDDPDYWKALLKQISVLWWTPLGYTAEDIQKIVDPALILMGDRDGMFEIEQAVDLYRFIPNAELAILPNATHFSAINELSIGIILDFFLRHIATE